MRSVLDAAAQYERALIRGRTKAALAVKRERGERISRHVPYGFRLAEDGVRLVADEAEQGVIAIVRELHAAGMSERGIVAALAARGLVSRAGKPFAKTQVHNLLVRDAA
jgi:DNA invertase Pin-like site-specific DNA recombinase